LAEKNPKDFKLEVQQDGEKKERSDAGEWIEPFLKTLALTANVKMACRQAGITRKTAYQWKEQNPEFAELWADAIEDGLDLLEYAMFKRGVATSDRAAEFLLRVHRYKDAVKLEHSGPAGGPISLTSSNTVTIMDPDPDDDEA
jgi:hypothetical protein